MEGPTPEPSPPAHDLLASRREVDALPSPASSPEAETCDWCGSTDLWWRNCKLLCRSCSAIVKSCADL
jgi:hypothetical protein